MSSNAFVVIYALKRDIRHISVLKRDIFALKRDIFALKRDIFALNLVYTEHPFKTASCVQKRPTHTQMRPTKLKIDARAIKRDENTSKTDHEHFENRPSWGVVCLQIHLVATG